MTAPADASELLLCDTSFASLIAQRQTHPERFEHWDPNLVGRIDGATLAISVITLAEARYGYLKANWGAARIEREERRLQGFAHAPLDPAVLDEWARLKLASTTGAWNVADNDLWIAATATSRGWPLVTCDADQRRIDDAELEVLYLPRSPGSKA